MSCGFSLGVRGVKEVRVKCKRNTYLSEKLKVKSEKSNKAKILPNLNYGFWLKI